MARVKRNRNAAVSNEQIDLRKSSQVKCVFNADKVSAENESLQCEAQYSKRDSQKAYISNIVAQNIEALRKTYNLSQSQLADRIGFSVGTVSGVELRKTMPTVFFIFKISDVFHIPVEFLLSEQGFASYYNIHVNCNSSSPISTVFPFYFSKEEQQLIVQLHFVGNDNRKIIKKEVLQMLLEKVKG